MCDNAEEIKNLKDNKWLPETFSLSNDIKEIMNNYEQNGYKGTPEKKDIFNAFKIGDNGEIIKPQDVRILILGQDPYPEKDRAQGLAFSFKNGEKPADDSLLNIFKAIEKYKKDNGVKIKHSIKEWETNLETWASNNGVLLLNTALTYKENEEHFNYWEPFVKQIICNLLNSKIKKQGKNVAIFLWGKEAQKVFLQSLNDLNNKNFIDKIIENKNFLRNRKTKKIKMITCVKRETITLSTNIKIFMTFHPSNRYRPGTKNFLKDTPNHFDCCDKFLGKYIWKNFPDNNKKQ